MTDLANNYNKVIEDIANIQRAAMTSREVELIAVSKTFPPESIIELYNLGQRDFGENYATEFYDKVHALEELNIIWHFIGNLQSNKIKYIAPYTQWVHSIEKKSQIELLSKFRPTNLPKLNTLIQIKINHAPNQHGINIENINEIIELGDIINTTNNLNFRGFMGIASNTHDNSIIEKEYILLNEFFYMIKSSVFENIDTLSMGMSNDYTTAINSGATHVRIGYLGEREGKPLLFGTRPRLHKAFCVERVVLLLGV